MKNKIFKFFLFLQIIPFLFLACSKSKDNIIPDGDNKLAVIIYGSANIDTSEIFMSYKQDASLIIVESNLEWSASTDADWISLAAYRGDSGIKGVIVGVSDNEFIPRSAEINLVSGNVKHTINLVQEGCPFINFSVDDVEFKMILVEGGLYLMGYYITINSFYMCETEVTNALWEKITGNLPYDDPYDDKTHKADLPVSGISWNKINEEFLPVISELIGLQMRLPTEVEWEYAASGGKYNEGFAYAGSDVLKEVAWNGYNCNQKMPVATLKPNALGLYDMSGNVSEWCSDWYAPNFDYTNKDNPTGPDTGDEKVIRGGNFSNTVMFGQGAFHIKSRNSVLPDCSDIWYCRNVGFRFVFSF